jgi:hypothetical protein
MNVLKKIYNIIKSNPILSGVASCAIFAAILWLIRIIDWDFVNSHISFAMEFIKSNISFAMEFIKSNIWLVVNTTAIIGIIIAVKKERGGNQKRFNDAYKKIAEIYYLLASNEFAAIDKSEKEKCENGHWFRHFVNLGSFYFNLEKMSVFSSNELTFIRFIKSFSDRYEGKEMPMPDVKFFYHFLLFIEHAEKTNTLLSEGVKKIDTSIFGETIAIYKKLLGIFDYNKVIEYIKESGFCKERVQKMLELAAKYNIRPHLDKFNK